MGMNKVEVYIEICREGVDIPVYARQGDAGMDVAAAEDIILHPGETAIIPTGLKFAVPEGYEIQVRPRSGISLRTPLRISNSPGTIDSGYRDELGVIITNTSPPLLDNGNEIYTTDANGNYKGTYKIRKGDRIAQIVLQAVPQIEFISAISVKNIGVDRGGGFGSTGI